MFHDLREFLDQVAQLGAIKVIEGADWNLEIGLITELQISRPDQPLLLFDRIKGYSSGYRVVTNFLNTAKLFALTHGLPLDATGLELVNAWRSRIKAEFKPSPVVEVKTAPVAENILTGEDINLFCFPAPKWHALDGGRYIGTGSIVIQKEPDEGWVNLGTYRVQIRDKATAGIHIITGHHGDLIRRKYWDRGLACPAAVVCGADPLLWSVSSSSLARWGVSEYEYAGWLRGSPVAVIRGKTVDLPLPATAEIILEGEILPPGTEDWDEGPFGEWQGYYAGGKAKETAFKVKCILHRNDPIILGAPPQVGAYDFYWGRNIFRAADIWNELDKNMPGIRGVWVPTETRGPIMTIVSLRQMYHGQAKQAAMLVGGAYPGAYLSRYVVIVDDDIDPSNLAEVLWALGTRCDPASAIDIIRDCWSSRSDPILPPERKDANDLTCSKAIICACKPFHWFNEFPPSVKSSPELLEKTRQKWEKLLFENT